ncbi:MAG: hypothetical protein QQN41_12095, partial [Nitrosopumilus sp.]
RLLTITPFDKSVKRVTEQTAQTRNRLMIELADEITVGYSGKDGQVDELLKQTDKTITEIE